MKVTQFSKEICRQMAVEMEQALKSIGEKYGVAITPAGGTFSSTEWTTKFKVTCSGEQGEWNAKVDFSRLCAVYGLSPDDFGKEVTYGFKRYRIVGIRPRRSVYPILLEDTITRKSILMPAEQVRLMLGNSQ